MKVFGRWLLYFHTIRHLKPRQVLWRVWRKLPVFPSPGAGLAPALRRGDQPFAALPPKKPSLTGPDAFRFLNRNGRVRSAAGWNDPQADKELWEDIYDAYVVHHRRNEPRESLAAVKKLIETKAKRTERALQ